MNGEMKEKVKTDYIRRVKNLPRSIFNEWGKCCSRDECMGSGYYRYGAGVLDGTR